MMLFFFSVPDSKTCYVGWSVRPSQILLNWVQFPHYGPCPTVRDCLAVYPALFRRLYAFRYVYTALLYITLLVGQLSIFLICNLIEYDRQV